MLKSLIYQLSELLQCRPGKHVAESGKKIMTKLKLKEVKKNQQREHFDKLEFKFLM